MCEVVAMPGGGTAIVCGGHRRRKDPPCAVCGRSASLLCDGKVGGKSCDAPICSSCSVSPARGIDFCPTCAKGYQPRLEFA